MKIKDNFQDQSFKQEQNYSEFKQESEQVMSRFKVVDNYWEDLVERQHRLNVARIYLDADVTPLLSDKDISTMFDQGSSVSQSHDYVSHQTNQEVNSCLKLFVDLQCKESRQAYNLLKEVLAQEVRIVDSQSLTYGA